ncbi:hypothetical protein BaRGS_00021765 [Batillaria attramentaria]|uniref:Uncharacterized protein n=1 Tax=Batillaria attramentaria TaxID=370345 RepID=A0ABD0KIE6_9CAEN
MATDAPKRKLPRSECTRNSTTRSRGTVTRSSNTQPNGRLTADGALQLDPGYLVLCGRHSTVTVSLAV